MKIEEVDDEKKQLAYAHLASNKSVKDRFAMACGVEQYIISYMLTLLKLHHLAVLVLSWTQIEHPTDT